MDKGAQQGHEFSACDGLVGLEVAAGQGQDAQVPLVLGIPDIASCPGVRVDVGKVGITSIREHAAVVQTIIQADQQSQRFAAGHRGIGAEGPVIVAVQVCGVIGLYSLGVVAGIHADNDVGGALGALAGNSQVVGQGGEVDGHGAVAVPADAIGAAAQTEGRIVDLNGVGITIHGELHGGQLVVLVRLDRNGRGLIIAERGRAGVGNRGVGIGVLRDAVGTAVHRRAGVVLFGAALRLGIDAQVVRQRVEVDLEVSVGIPIHVVCLAVQLEAGVKRLNGGRVAAHAELDIVDDVVVVGIDMDRGVLAIVKGVGTCVADIGVAVRGLADAVITVAAGGGRPLGRGVDIHIILNVGHIQGDRAVIILADIPPLAIHPNIAALGGVNAVGRAVVDDADLTDFVRGILPVEGDAQVVVIVDLRIIDAGRHAGIGIDVDVMHGIAGVGHDFHVAVDAAEIDGDIAAPLAVDGVVHTVDDQVVVIGIGFVGAACGRNSEADHRGIAGGLKGHAEGLIDADKIDAFLAGIRVAAGIDLHIISIGGCLRADRNISGHAGDGQDGGAIHLAGEGITLAIDGDGAGLLSQSPGHAAVGNGNAADIPAAVRGKGNGFTGALFHGGAAHIAAAVAVSGDIQLVFGRTVAHLGGNHGISSDVGDFYLHAVAGAGDADALAGNRDSGGAGGGDSDILLHAVAGIEADALDFQLRHRRKGHGISPVRRNRLRGVAAQRAGRRGRGGRCDRVGVMSLCGRTDFQRGAQIAPAQPHSLYTVR